jgi:hypothetical protein
VRSGWVYVPDIGWPFFFIQKERHLSFRGVAEESIESLLRRACRKGTRYNRAQVGEIRSNGD